MAIRILRIDDVDGTDGAEIFAFTLGGIDYEIDLCPRNRAKFLRAIGPFVEQARLLELSDESEATANQRVPLGENRSADHPGRVPEVESPSGTLDLSESARLLHR